MTLHSPKRILRASLLVLPLVGVAALITVTQWPGRAGGGAPDFAVFRSTAPAGVSLPDWANTAGDIRFTGARLARHLDGPDGGIDYWVAWQSQNSAFSHGGDICLIRIVWKREPVPRAESTCREPTAPAVWIQESNPDGTIDVSAIVPDDVVSARAGGKTDRAEKNLVVINGAVKDDTLVLETAERVEQQVRIGGASG